MEYVEPIRDKKQLDNMKRYLLNEKGLRDYLLFVLGINSGLRISDLLALKVVDVRDVDRVSIREGKTGKSKDFPLSTNCIKAIKDYLKDTNLSDDSPLFPSRKKSFKDGSQAEARQGAISRQQAYDIINEAAKAVGINDAIGTHTLRKTFGYWAYKAGHDITRIQQLLNHSAPSVTLRYIGITKEDLDKIYIDLNL